MDATNQNTYRFINKIKSYMISCKMVEEGETILAAVSGGADSVCMLLVLDALSKQMRFSLAALHVNHGIREEAGEDAEFVEKLCKKYQIPFYLEQIDVPKIVSESGQTEEEAGRIARYKVLLERAEAIGASHIAVAHHMNDQAETFILNLCRGSGIRGLSGIKPVRDKIIRPLLCAGRNEIEEYLGMCGESFVTDRTNLEDDHTRNRIRHHVLPMLNDMVNSGSNKHIFEAAGMLREIEDYLEEEAREIVLIKKLKADNIDINSLREYKPLLQKYILMEILGTVIPHRINVSRYQIDSLFKMCQSTSGCEKTYFEGGIYAKREYNKLYIGKEKPDLSKEEKTGNPLPEILFKEFEVTEKFEELQQRIPYEAYTKWFDYDKILSSPSLRYRKVGDRISIDSDGHGKSLKKYMIDERIPASRRDSIPLLCDGENIMWVIGYRMSSAYQISEETRHILEVSVFF